MIHGFLLPFDALILILRHPTLLVQASIPMIITLGLYVFGFKIAQTAAQNAIVGALTHWGISNSTIAWLVVGVTQILILVVGAMLFSAFATIIASPFNDWLSERTEKWAFPALPPVPKQSVAAKIRIVWIDVAKTIASAIATFSMILFSWIPILNLIAFILACWLMTFQYVSYSQTRRGLSLIQGIRFLTQHPFSCFGFGLSLMIGFSIPFFGCFVLPLAVIGGTLLCARAQSPSVR